MWNSANWANLIDGSGCPICQNGGPKDILADVGIAWVTAQPDAPLPGYVCVVAKRHVIEPYELDRADGHALWDALTSVGRGLRGVTGAVKLNYEIHGNTIPHLHIHLYPRFPGDPFEGRPIAPAEAAPFHRSRADLEVLKAAISHGAKP